MLGAGTNLLVLLTLPVANFCSSCSHATSLKFIFFLCVCHSAGYHTIHLSDRAGEPVKDARLFVYIDIMECDPQTK